MSNSVIYTGKPLPHSTYQPHVELHDATPMPSAAGTYYLDPPPAHPRSQIRLTLSTDPASAPATTLLTLGQALMLRDALNQLLHPQLQRETTSPSPDLSGVDLSPRPLRD